MGTDIFDLAIVNGRLLDGTGNPWVRGDLGVRADRVAFVGPGPLPGPAARTLDAAGRVVCPGFIDTHSHAELALLDDARLIPKISQGITTEVITQDGLSTFPVDDTTRALFRQRLGGLLGPSQIPWPWNTAAEYLQALEARGIAPNVVALAPHGMIRALVLGMEARAPTPAELAQMVGHLERCLDDGARGISTGLIYPPCVYADADELVALCGVVARRGGPLVVHMRNESDLLLEAAREMVGVAERSGIALHISHIKAGGRDNWGKSEALLALLDEARRRGLDITCDQYPYLAGSTMLHAVLPPWAHAGGADALRRRLSDPSERARIAAALEADDRHWENWARLCGWDRIVVSAVATERNRTAEGHSAAEIARARGCSPADAVCDLLLEENLGVTMITHYGDEADLRRFMRWEGHMVGTDGIFGGRPHPRLYGTFPRILGTYVREAGVLSLPDAVRRMTAMPAARFRLHDRGLLRPGMAADVVVFDQDRIVDRATYENPHHTSDGIAWVLVNGRVVWEDGRHTGALPGKVLRSRE